VIPDPLVGTLLDGRYRVEAAIATGGMSTVYRGLDTRLDRPVALKVMHDRYAGAGRCASCWPNADRCRRTR